MVTSRRQSEWIKSWEPGVGAESFGAGVSMATLTHCGLALLELEWRQAKLQRASATCSVRARGQATGQ